MIFKVYVCEKIQQTSTVLLKSTTTIMQLVPGNLVRPPPVFLVTVG
jgi:hypothetical protein